MWKNIYISVVCGSYYMAYRIVLYNVVTRSSSYWPGLLLSITVTRSAKNTSFTFLVNYLLHEHYFLLKGYFSYANTKKKRNNNNNIICFTSAWISDTKKIRRISVSTSRCSLVLLGINWDCRVQLISLSH